MLCQCDIDRLYLSCQVKWAEQQKILHRVKRDGIPTDPKFREMWYLVSNLIGKIFYVCKYFKRELAERQLTSQDILLQPVAKMLRHSHEKMSNFDKGWRRDQKHKIMDRPFMPKHGTVS